MRENSTSILVSWDRVPDGKRDGKIISYRVDYNQSTVDSAAPKVIAMSGKVDGSKRSLLLKNIELNADYTITVSASTRKGYGPASDSVKVPAGW